MAAEADATEPDWDVVGFVASSEYRVRVIDRLTEGPATPSTIAADESISIASVSHALRQLRERDLVELLVDEDRRKGRFYGITDAGEEMADHIEEVVG